MKVPTWATVLGVLMILFGGCGVINNVQKINTPKALDQSSGMMAELSRELDKAMDVSEENSNSTDSTEHISSDSTVAQDGEEGLKMLKESMENMMTFSDYYKKWIVRIGYLGIIVSIFYAIAGVLLLMGKKYAIKLAYAAVGLSLMALIFQIIVLALDDESGMIAGMTNIGAYFMVFINIIFIVVLLASDKTYFYQLDNEHV